MTTAMLATELRRATVGVMHGNAIIGSGVVWGPGSVVTNAHVARDAHVAVRLADGRRADGLVVARSADVDLALLRVESIGLPAPLPAIGLDEPRVGSIILAIGHPFGMRAALTMGILHSMGPITTGGRPWLQADLRLAPGYSGGPLADAAGRLLGVNAMMLGSLALAIPVSEIRRFLEDTGVRPA
jgi:serine protease Do